MWDVLMSRMGFIRIRINCFKNINFYFRELLTLLCFLGNCLRATVSLESSLSASQTRAHPPLPKTFIFVYPLGQRLPYIFFSVSDKSKFLGLGFLSFIGVPFWVMNEPILGFPSLTLICFFETTLDLKSNLPLEFSFVTILFSSLFLVFIFSS